MTCLLHYVWSGREGRAILCKVPNGGPVRGRVMSQCPPNDSAVLNWYFLQTFDFH